MVARSRRPGVVRVAVGSGSVRLALHNLLIVAVHRFGASPPKADAWEEGFQQLAAFVAHEGHARVPQTRRDGDVALAVWVQRQRYANKKGRLSPERQARLEALPGWSWDTRRDE